MLQTDRGNYAQTELKHITIVAGGGAEKKMQLEKEPLNFTFIILNSSCSCISR